MAEASRQVPSTAPVVWLTGLSGAGKSTLGRALLVEYVARGRDAHLLDGDEVRAFFEGDLGYTRPERIHNVRRVAFAAHVLSLHGVCVIVANIAPYIEVRDFIRKKIQNYHQIYVQASVDTVRRRDVQGHYGRVSRGQETNFVGVDDAYEPPRSPDLVICTDAATQGESMRQLVAYLETAGAL